MHTLNLCTVSKIKQKKGVQMMNKKILLSVVAAATIGSVFTGCGSSSTTAAEVDAASGNAQKAALSGATVTVGSATGTTATDGSWTATGAAVATDGDAVTVSGGDMVMVDGSLVPNTVTLKSTIDDENPENTVSMATTLMVDLVADGLTKAQAQAKAADVLGLEITELYTQPNALPAIKKNKQVALWRLLTFAKGSDTARAALITNLKTADVSDFQAMVDAAVTAIAAGDATLDVTNLRADMAVLSSPAVLVLQEEALLKIIATTTSGSITSDLITAAQAAYSNVLNLDTTAGAYSFELDGINQNISYTSVSDVSLASASLFDADNASAELNFSLVDLATVAPTGETGTMTIEMSDDNGNSSYKMSLSNLTVASVASSSDSNDYVTLGMNENVSVSITAVSNMNVSTHFSNSDLNITALCATNLIDSDADDISLNLSTFANYVRTNAEEDSSATNGNFSTSMVGNGNYSIKVNADFNSKSMTFGEGVNAYSKAPKYTTTVDGVEYTGYKILDANLEK